MPVINTLSADTRVNTVKISIFFRQFRLSRVEYPTDTHNSCVDDSFVRLVDGTLERAYELRNTRHDDNNRIIVRYSLVITAVRDCVNIDFCRRKRLIKKKPSTVIFHVQKLIP